MPPRCTASFPRPGLLLAALLSSLLAFIAPHARAQADPAEFKTQSLSVYAGYLHDRIDFYPASDNGVAFGLDFTRYFRFPIQPSLEGRVNLASGPLANERSYMGGVRAEYHVGRFIPYADYLLGFGTIHFNPASGYPILGDNSTVYSPGGGIDIDLVHHVRAKIDFQHQYWNTGHLSITQFQPNLLTIGVSYPIPFRAFHRQGEPHY